MKKSSLIFILILGMIFSATAQDIRLPKNVFGAMRARSIGPATMSGRITTIAAVDENPNIIYVGSAGGGIWKSTDGGVKFKPVFDRYVMSIGNIAIDQKHPDTVWVGTGEPWTRNTTSVGMGVYKSVNAGRSWKYMGLKETERIGKIAINPQNPDIVFVAALGHLWGPNPDRGLFRTTDGGKTWEKVLYVDQNTGCTDVEIDPENPNIVYAAMWQFRRYPYFFYSGGKGSGLYKSTDGGKTWKKLTNGLPTGELGRITVAIAPSKPNIVYAIVESKETALYKSTDRGQHWEKVSSVVQVQERPFYFSELLVDPQNENVLYKPGFQMYYSTNGGKTFSPIWTNGGNVHADVHTVYVNPHNNKLIYIGTDGGVYISSNGGDTWRMVRTIPVSQFYHVRVDNRAPYFVYGGLQDNGSWYGPSNKNGSITNCDWNSVGFGDGFNCFPDPYNPDVIYWEYQEGNFYKAFRSTGEYKSLKPARDKSVEELRFNWNTPVVFSPTRNVMYFGAQYLYKSYNNGDTWIRISPDLTTNDKSKQQQEKTGGLTLDNSGAENYCTIYTINESPVDTNVIWVGTDDGNLQVTTDGGKHWTNVVKNIPDLPPNTWVSYVWPSRFDRNTAYVTFDGHQSNDFTPYVYKTTDLGKTWTNISDGIQGYCHVIQEDYKKPGLLFLGTEFGLYISLDDGKNWTRFTGGLPRVAVRDMDFQKREDDLVLATHGRGIYIIDDLSPLRQITPQLLDSDLVFLGKKDFIVNRTMPEWGPGTDMLGDDIFRGKTIGTQAYITYYMKKRHIFGDMHIELYDSAGNFIRKIPPSPNRGINRVYFSIRMKPPKIPPSPQMIGFRLQGPEYPPGRYIVKVFKNGKVYQTQIRLLPNPKLPYSVADQQLRYKTLMKAYHLLEKLTDIDAMAVELSRQARQKAKKASPRLAKKLNAYADELEQIHKQLVATKVGRITGEKRIRERLGELYINVNMYKGRPTQSQIEGIDFLGSQIESYEKKINSIYADMQKLGRQLQKQGIDPIKYEKK